MTNTTPSTTDSDAVQHFNSCHPTCAAMTESYVEVNGAKLHYVSAGQGPLVIFYHGFPSFWYMWHRQIAALRDKFTVVAVDGLGSNLSDRPAQVSEYKIPRLASDIDKLARHLAGDEAFYLVGHDWGGALSWAFAQHYPKRLKKLAVLSAPPYNLFVELLRNNKEQQLASTYMQRLKNPEHELALLENNAYPIWSLGYGKLIEQGKLTAEEGSLFRQALAQPGALSGGINWYRANLPALEHINDQLYWPSKQASTNVPSLLIWGQEDKTFVAQFIEQLPNYASQLQTQIIPKAGHWPSLTHATKVNQYLLDFFTTS